LQHDKNAKVRVETSGEQKAKHICKMKRCKLCIRSDTSFTSAPTWLMLSFWFYV